MSQGVIYQLSGPSHATMLAVSIWSLRRWYDGPITICHTKDCKTFAKLLAEDNRIQCDTKLIRLVSGAKKAHMVTKTSTFLDSPYDHTVFLDTDVMIQSPIDTLWDHELAVTEAIAGATIFGPVVGYDYGNMLRRRINYIARQSTYTQRLTELCHEVNPPLVNTGVIVYHKDDHFMINVHLLSLAGRSFGMMDESSIQLLLATIDHYTLLPPTWNFLVRNSATDKWKQANIVHLLANSANKEPGKFCWQWHLDHAWDSNAGDVCMWGNRTPPPRRPMLSTFHGHRKRHV
jgi:hypothetical protein